MENMDDTQKQAIEFWVDTRRFLDYASCTDSVVANNMAQNICNLYKEKPGIPSSLSGFLIEHLEGKFGDIDTNIAFIKSCQDEIFTFILCNLYPSFKEYTVSISSPLSISDVAPADDRFDNFTETSILEIET